MKNIVLTGGGTAGHVTPNMALIERLREAGWSISYIGSYDGIEKSLIEGMGIPYYGISSGKLRRYIDLKNLSDPFRVIRGFFQAKKLLRKLAPAVVFSKGGFVSVPVVMAAGMMHIPAVIHESDMTPGLANKLCIPFATKVCCNFEDTMKYLPKGKAVHTGTPLRQELFAGNAEAGRSFAGFTDDKPIILVVGGSTGSVVLNRAIRNVLTQLNGDYNVIHLCGKGKMDEQYEGRPGYVQYEYISTELKDLFAASSLIISRAGANAVCELLALRKPNILIPLSAAASRGDQILNAASFEKHGYSYVLREENVSGDSLMHAIETVMNNRDSYIAAMQTAPQRDSTGRILALITDAADPDGE